ncbi:MAG: type II toxin-antitoxin system RelE/ParE family toxin, partial [Deltaproteobacteria bacterium]
MKIRILESAKEDLKEGFYFYELQRKGVGKYFLE